ncbi:MAG TPA: hypothetical protein VF693_07395 [Allosphingosinicella sp.]|jgi:hypothetical protein
MKQLKSIASGAAFFASAVFLAADPALAGFPVPGPVLGAGLPALALIAGGYYLIRRRRRG